MTDPRPIDLACPECGAAWRTTVLPSHCPVCGKGGVLVPDAIKRPIDVRLRFTDDPRKGQPQ